MNWPRIGGRLIAHIYDTIRKLHTLEANTEPTREGSPLNTSSLWWEGFVLKSGVEEWRRDGWSGDENDDEEERWHRDMRKESNQQKTDYH